MTSVQPFVGRDQSLRQLSRYLCGVGVELGPGHVPFPLPYPATTARYLDRWQPEENRLLFPEIGTGAEFPVPDIVADLNVDRLGMLSDESQDFVIASHVLEHLCDPLAHLEEIHRVLRPGGVAVVLLPDRRLTFDRKRPPTTLDHLIAEHSADSRVVDNAHLEEFLRYCDEWDDSWDDDERAAQFDRHRQRSIHVHCWAQEEFLPVLLYAVSDLKLSFELVDAVFHEDVSESIEFGFVLRRCLTPGDPSALAARMSEVWHELASERRAVRDGTRDAAEVARLRVQLAEAAEYVQQIAQNAADVNAELERLRSHPAFRLASSAKKRLTPVLRLATNRMSALRAARSARGEGNP